MTQRITTSAIAILAAVFALAGCDESLPPRDEPLAILRGSFAMTDTFVVVHDTLPIGTTGSFKSTVRNTYEDVLEDSALIQVDYHIAMEEFPENTATIQATRADVVTQRVLNGAFVTIEPDSVLVVQKKWPHYTDTGAPFWSLVELRPGSDPSGRSFLQSDPVPLLVTASIRTFKRVPAIVIGPVRIIVIYRIIL